jgi:hypothetical protein
MARCHRIGQEKEVTVYRLVSKSTYEQQLFECSSRKMGLDEAILGFAGTGEQQGRCLAAAGPQGCVWRKPQGCVWRNTG